jgi:hypothetical protein
MLGLLGEMGNYLQIPIYEFSINNEVKKIGCNIILDKAYYILQRI